MTVIPLWQAIANGVKKGIEQQIPADCLLSGELPNDASNIVQASRILSPKQLEIVNLDATDLRDAIVARKYTSVETTEAYIRAAAVVHQATNCLMDFFPGEALERAQQLDDILKKTGKTVGPLHGVPVSIKGVRGHEISAGFASWIGKNIPEKDGVLVGILRDAGAVFYVKTTNPQAIMHLETDSFLGPTVNPFNRNLTAGGSSGGEGALLGAKGSAMGIGTDIGGSIRSPAALNGIYGFKPTSVRLPKGGNKSEMVGQESIAGAIGPMTRSARDLSLCIETILAAQPWKVDSSQVGMSWRPDEIVWKGGNKPRIGVMWDDGEVLPQPPMRRALQTCVDKLKAEGFEVVDYKSFKQAEAWEILTSLYYTDGASRIKKAMAETGEPILPLTQWIMEQNTKDRSSLEVFELVKRRERFRSEYNAHFMAADIDLILCPPGPGPAPVLGTSKYWGFTSIFNLVDYPAGVLPTGEFVTSEDIPDKEGDRTFMSDDDKDISAAYSVDAMIGAPLSLQVVAQRWDDEKAVLGLQVIDSVLRKP